jgi:hypothetical protein
MPISEYRGVDIPLELERMNQLENEEKPCVIVHATDPDYPSGSIHYAGMSLKELNKYRGTDGKITMVGAVFNQREVGDRFFVWTPKITGKNPIAEEFNEILELIIY